MTFKVTPVAVIQLPETFNTERERIFLGELDSCIGASRPRIVLDCSNLLQLDKPAVHLMLCCLEEALKRNGDVKLAEIPNGASPILILPGLESLCEVFDTVSDAVDCFRKSSFKVSGKNDTPSFSHSNSSNEG